MKKFICPAPWRTTCVTTSGHFRVCSEAQSSQSRGVIRNAAGESLSLSEVTSPLDLMNSSTLQDLRTRMLAEQDVADFCQRCLSEESNGLPSARTRALEMNPDFNEAVARAAIDDQGLLKNPQDFQQLVIRLGNKCNLSCRMCGPSSSTGWYKEWYQSLYKGFHDEGGRVQLLVNDKGQVIPEGNPYGWAEDGSALNFLKSCGQNLNKINFSGGEPLLSFDHLEILKYLVASGQSRDMMIDYNTNLTVLSDEILKLWESFKSVYVGVSIDGSPVVNEYIRYPTKTESLVRNLKKLDQSNVAGIFWLASTIQIYNVFDVLSLEQWFADLGLKRFSQDISWHILRSPKELSIYALPQSVKEAAAELSLKTRNFKEISSAIFSEDFSKIFSEFFPNTYRMDQHRNQSLKNLETLWDQLAPFSS